MSNLSDQEEQKKLIVALENVSLSPAQVKMLNALAKNPNSTALELAQILGYDKPASWNVHFGKMCGKLEPYLWAAPASKERKGKLFYSGILVNFNYNGRSFTLKPHLEEVFRDFGIISLEAHTHTNSLKVFEQQTAHLPRTTETERLVVQRIGQDIFRKQLLLYWKSRCPLTGIDETRLLRASHIIPWTECESDAQRLDSNNGILLSALWDAAFDSGLVSFEDNGSVLFSSHLNENTKRSLCFDHTTSVKGFTEGHQEYLSYHRSFKFDKF